ncbi:ATP-dependent DNA helicase RecG [Reichenbachiella agarivorans]|uniref:ATP-dependent DNA helicase RecG n=1 Tax=Reichenbachiella agarivorans TaxID=2979464 RepID=A0ABY6CUL3_9BACT|nr:ATP-dependent DNA helicase RecG [Reichenbachiella agarivorans]UXP33584.1 ATP-dependent DNA helicase RecG [Reichenbachiella agarivorans]
MASFLQTKIEFLKGVGPVKAKLLEEELLIVTVEDLLNYFPFRYENRSHFSQIKDLEDNDGYVQIKGVIVGIGLKGESKKQRLSAQFADQTGEIELLWFKGVNWMIKKLKAGVPYVVYGKPVLFNGKFSISHPEIEIITPGNEQKGDDYLPVYPTTEKLKRRYIDSKALSKLVKSVLQHPSYRVDEIVDSHILQNNRLIGYQSALSWIHFPHSQDQLQQALLRLKFNELFFIQLKIFQEKVERQEKHRGIVFKKSHLVNEFYTKHKPFELTDAQKRVVKEIYTDLQSGYQMNRLMQGDVGSGKTITAFICMLIAISNGYQTSIMAPTEILATQHYHGLAEFSEKLGLKTALITGSTKKSLKKKNLDALKNGELDIIVGTHALIEDNVEFQNLGLVVIDEQHRFGVAQRAKLWQKSQHHYPHVLVMTATPIPRTLAMTLYGDLEISTIDQLPQGRKPIKTTQLTDANRSKLFGFIRRQIEEGRQVYIVYPLIEESETLAYKDLMDGYESISRAFPHEAISILHGKMKAADKEYEMKRFLKCETKIMVATTVIEVGVNVPNASVMVIENAERFGLSQLHQLRGRVGRGADQSYCILMSGPKLSKEARERIKCMVETTDGFKIAEKDLEIRGPGDLLGTQQSGLLDLKIADITQDSHILKLTRELARQILASDPELSSTEHSLIKKQLFSQKRHLLWSNIS